MAEYQDREHFIPLRVGDLIDLLGAHPDLPPEAREPFRQFCRLITATFHFEYHRHLDELKNAYAPFDPDADTIPLAPPTPDGKAVQLDTLFAGFIRLMERANFKHVGQEQIQAALQDSSSWGVNMEVDFSVFDRLEIFARGDALGKRSRRRLRNWWRLEEIQLPVYQRLVLILKLRPHKRLGRGVDTDHVFLKDFKDIPKLDLEMLLPGTRLQMPHFEKGKLGASFLSTLGILAYKVLTDLGHLAWTGFTHGNPLALWGLFSLVAGYGYRQYQGYQKTKQSYNLKLTQSLYYQNLENNAGVLYRLLDDAEEQECREAILAYFVLWGHAGGAGLTGGDLDDRVEQFLERHAGVKVDFEVGDAVAKLERLRIVERLGDRYRARPLAQALQVLDWSWDNFFKFSTAGDPLDAQAAGFLGNAGGVSRHWRLR